MGNVPSFETSTGVLDQLFTGTVVTIMVYKMLAAVILYYLFFLLQDVAVFAYESKGSLVGGQTPGGGRRFLVTTYYQFGQCYMLA